METNNITKMFFGINENENDYLKYDEQSIEVDDIKLLSVNDILNLEVNDNNWLYYPLVHREGITMISGAPAVRKSFFSLLLCLSLTNIKKNRFEVKGWEPKINKNVNCLYIDGEMSNFSIKERFKDICKENQTNNNHLSYLTLANLYDCLEKQQKKGVFDFDITLENEVFQQWIMKTCKKNQFKLVVFDNLLSLTKQDINSQQNYLIINRLFMKLRALGISVLIVHHNNKGGKNFLGSSTISANLDIHINLSLKSDGNNKFKFEKFRSQIEENEKEKFLEYDTDNSMFFSTSDRNIEKQKQKEMIDKKIIEMLQENKKGNEISEHLKKLYPNVKGISQSSITRIKKKWKKTLEQQE